MKLKTSASHDLGFRKTTRQIESQGKDLSRFLSQLKSRSVDRPDPQASIFCGAGDSLACALFVERLTHFRSRAMEPSDIVLFPQVARNKNVFFVSVSGLTTSNIDASIAVRGKANSTTAITANGRSALAENCSRTIELRFTKEKGKTPGTNSFTASLLACSYLSGEAESIELEKLIERSKDWAQGIAGSFKPRVYYFIGSGLFYPIAMYGAFKMHEFSGVSADFELTEEFSHSKLFSIEKKNTLVIIAGSGEDDKRAYDLYSLLKASGFSAVVLPPFDKKQTPLNTAIWYSICFQYLALFDAQRRGLEEPYFLSDDEKLDISNKMIY